MPTTAAPLIGDQGNMRFFIYEFVTGGGWWNVDRDNPPRGSLRSEGSAMLFSLMADFASLGSVCTLQDIRCPNEYGNAEVKIVASASDERRHFAELTRSADWTVVIAPEFDGYLLGRCEWVKQFGGRLLGPDLDFVSIASDKELTAQALAAAGVAVPRGQLISKFESLTTNVFLPAVMNRATVRVLRGSVSFGTGAK